MSKYLVTTRSTLGNTKHKKFNSLKEAKQYLEKQKVKHYGGVTLPTQKIKKLREMA